METVVVTSFLLMSEDEVNLVELYKNEKSESHPQQPQLIQEQPQELTEEQMLRAPCGTFRVTRPPKIYFDRKFYDQNQIVDIINEERNRISYLRQQQIAQKQIMRAVIKQCSNLQQQLKQTNQKLQGVEKQLKLTETENSSLKDTIVALDEIIEQK